MLSRRALNRAFLARQLLLERVAHKPLDVIEHLVGLQAQAPQPPYVGLWTRIRDFVPHDLSQLLLDRSAVRIILMRSTVHLVSAADCLRLRPAVQPCLDRAVGPRGWRRLAGVEPGELAAHGRAWLDEEPRSAAELNQLLGKRWPDVDRPLLARALRAVVPMVQIPPRGLWGRSGRPVYATAETWLGAPLHPEPSLPSLVRRYLAAFGPASVADIQLWCGLTHLREIVEAERHELIRFTDENGTELFDLPDAPRPGPDADSPVRFLAEFDNAVLSHADRSRIIGVDDQKRIITKNALVLGTVLVDGFVSGLWRVENERKRSWLVITPFRPLSGTERGALTEEGGRLLRFMAPDADDQDVIIQADHASGGREDPRVD